MSGDSAQADSGRRVISFVGAGGKTRRSVAGQAHPPPTTTPTSTPPLKRGEDCWFAVGISGTKAGARYKFRIDDEIDVPDPASAFQPEDVFGRAR